MNGSEPSDVKLVRHLECQGQSNGISWIIPDDHFKAVELARRGLRLVESDNANKYHLVATEAVGTPSILNIVEAITNTDIMVTIPLDWFILLIKSMERICSSFEG